MTRYPKMLFLNHDREAYKVAHGADEEAALEAEGYGPLFPAQEPARVPEEKEAAGLESLTKAQLIALGAEKGLELSDKAPKAELIKALA